jgi:hypothetical protein
VLTLALIVLIVGTIALALFFYVGAMFLQGYIYTEPSQDLYWQAPAAGGALALFLALWCVLVASAEGATPRDIPYDTVFHFTPNVDLLKEPPREIWAVYKDGQEKPYKRDRLGQTTYRYVDPSYTPSRPWKGDGVEGIILIIDGEKLLFKRVPSSESYYSEFVSDNGWIMKEYADGPTGMPSAFRWSRFLMTLLLNFGHLLLWWLCLWLLLRFQWGHALGLAFVLWLVCTLSILPMLLSSAAEVAEGKAISTSQRSTAVNSA